MAYRAASKLAKNPDHKATQRSAGEGEEEGYGDEF